jgi:hypothetical protein
VGSAEFSVLTRSSMVVSTGVGSGRGRPRGSGSGDGALLGECVELGAGSALGDSLAPLLAESLAVAVGEGAGSVGLALSSALPDESGAPVTHRQGSGPKASDPPAVLGLGVGATCGSGDGVALEVGTTTSAADGQSSVQTPYCSRSAARWRTMSRMPSEV